MIENLNENFRKSQSLFKDNIKIHELNNEMFKKTFSKTFSKTENEFDKKGFMQETSNELIKQLIEQSSPQLLEPYMNVEISLPEHCIGDILSDITGKRGG